MEERKTRRRSARNNKGRTPTFGGGGPANAFTDTSNDEEWDAFMEAYDQYRNQHEHTAEQCRAMVDACLRALPTKTIIPNPDMGIAVPTSIVSGGASAAVLAAVEADYHRARKVGQAEGASSDVGASSWRTRDHKKIMENTMVGPSAPPASGDSVVSDDTISIGSGYTVRTDEGNDEVGTSPRSAPSSSSIHMQRIKLGCSFLLGGRGMGSTGPGGVSTSSGLGGEKRTFASIEPNDTLQTGQLVTPFGRKIAKRPKLLSGSASSKGPPTNRTGWNGLDPNLLHDILSRLNLREKVRCVGKVCRAWSELRTRSDLFTDLSDASGPNGTDMKTLLRWLPSSVVAGVTGIRLHAVDDEWRFEDFMGESVPSQFGDAMEAESALIQLANAMKDKTLSSIETIVFSGPKIEVLGVIGTAVDLGIGPALRSITLDELSHEYAVSVRSSFRLETDLSELSNLLEKTKKLEELRLPVDILPMKSYIRAIPSLLSVIGPPDVIATHLKVLDLTMRIVDPPDQEVSFHEKCHCFYAKFTHAK